MMKMYFPEMKQQVIQNNDFHKETFLDSLRHKGLDAFSTICTRNS